MPLRSLAVIAFIAVIPCLAFAQGLEGSWSVGTSIGVQPVVRDGANTGTLAPALMLEGGFYRVDHRHRFGALVQVVPFPATRVEGVDLSGEQRSGRYTGPEVVLRVLTDYAPPLSGSIEPSVGLGYTFYVKQPSGCTAGTDSPLCSTAVGIHGAHGPTGHASISLRTRAHSTLALRVGYLVTRARDVITQDATVGINWRPNR